MSVFFNFGEIEKYNSIVPKGHRNYSFFSFKSSIFIKTEETLRQSARGGSPTATSLPRKGGLRRFPFIGGTHPLARKSVPYGAPSHAPFCQKGVPSEARRGIYEVQHGAVRVQTKQIINGERIKALPGGLIRCARDMK